MGFFQHRKLIGSVSTTINVTEVCSSFCDKTAPSYLCPTTCSVMCPGTCLSYLDIPPLPPPPPPPVSNKNSHKASTVLTLTIALLAASFLLVCGYALYAKYYNNASRRRNNSNNDDPSSSLSSNPQLSDQTRDFLDEEHGAMVDHHVWYIRTVGLEPAIIGSITALKYRKDEGLIEGTECAVCLSEFLEDETLRLLPKCSHAFHVDCIDTWLRSHTNCPMCRAPILVAAVRSSSPPPETSSGNSSSEEQIRVAISTINVEVNGDVEVGNVVESSSTEVQQRIESSRRSPSLDCLDDKGTLEVVGKLRTNGEKTVCGEKKLERLRSGGSSNNNGRSNGVQSGHGSSMKRSHSCNGKFVMCRPIRITDSILPLRSI